MPRTNLLAILAASLCVTLAAHASSPDVRKIVPRGAQRGTEIDVSFVGARLKEAKEVILYDKGLEVTKLEATKPEEVKVHLKIAQDCRLGEHRMRLRCETGISELRTFWVGPFPTTQAWARLPKPPPPKPGTTQPTTKPTMPNTAWEDPQPIGGNLTVEGVIENEQVHYYKIDAKKGQRITAEVEGMRLGTTMFDPYLELDDLNKFAIATCDDTALLKQDPFISLIAPKDGPFILQVRESSFGGSGDCHYRLNIGTFPRPLVVFPLGGQVGQTMKVQFLGDAAGPIEQEIKLPDKPVDEMPLYAVKDGQSPPSPNYFRVSPFPNVMEEGDSNHEMGKAIEAKMEPPLAFNGVIAKPAEEDFFKFKAHKGQAVEISVWARRLRSPLDSVITVWTEKGQYLASNDDAGQPDSILRFTPPEDGNYVVMIRDHLKAGGPEYAYRMEVTTPRLAVTLSIPNATQVNGPSQERQTIPVPRGNRYATLIRATRAGAQGDLTLAGDPLPDGITMIAEPFHTQTDVTPVVFEARPDAPIAGKLCDFAAKSGDEKQSIESTLTQQVELVIGQPNNTPYSNTKVHQLAVAVTQEAPFKIELEQPKAVLPQGGVLKLKCKAERKGDFKGNINLKMLFDPPGVGAQPVDLKPDKTEVEFPLSASEGAAPRKWKICLIGVSDVNGPLWVSTQLVDLEVAAPFVTGKAQMAAIEQGAAGQVTCELTQQNKFEGKAKVELLGLPANTSAEPKEITAEDKTVTFDVKSTPKAAVGQNGSLFVQATIQQNGETITQAFAKGGVIRIDPPKAAAPAPKPAAQQAAAVQGPAKTVSRLEKLRQEQDAEKK
jgi:hypothetical protein